MAQPPQPDFQKKSSPSPVAAPSQAMAPRPFPPQADVVAPALQAPDVAAPDAPVLDSVPAFPKLNFQVRAAGGSPPPLQPKLTIGAPNDPYEQEADRVAAQVVQRIHSPAANLPTENRTYQAQSVQRQAWPEQPVLQMKSTLQRETLPDEEDELQMKPLTGQIQRMELPEDDELQMKPFLQQQGSRAVAASDDLESAIQQSRGGGQPLADSIREPMEQAFGGVDFRGVKVHTDGRSDQLNRSIQSKAFTTGQDIFFRQGTYQPENRGGQELVAHELTHVVQQNAGVVQRQAQDPVDSASIAISPRHSIQRADGLPTSADLAQEGLVAGKRVSGKSLFAQILDVLDDYKNSVPEEDAVAKEIALQKIKRLIDAWEQAANKRQTRKYLVAGPKSDQPKDVPKRKKLQAISRSITQMLRDINSEKEKEKIGDGTQPLFSSREQRQKIYQHQKTVELEKKLPSFIKSSSKEESIEFETLKSYLSKCNYEESSQYWSWHGPYKSQALAWKIHISASSDNALDIARVVSPIAREAKFTHKFDVTQGWLTTTKETQKGKYITIYLPSEDEASEDSETEALIAGTITKVVHILDAALSSFKGEGVHIASEFPTGSSQLMYMRHGQEEALSWGTVKDKFTAEEYATDGGKNAGKVVGVLSGKPQWNFDEVSDKAVVFKYNEQEKPFPLVLTSKGEFFIDDRVNPNPTGAELPQGLKFDTSTSKEKPTVTWDKDKLRMKPDLLQRNAVEGEGLHMKQVPQELTGTVAVSQEIEQAICQSRGGGQPLAQSIRHPMEQAFGGVDFREVKVHTDGRSDQLNRSIQAKAFTTGQDIFFREGAYNPSSHSGQELLAHELTHVVQQTGTQSSSLPSLSRQMIQRTTVKTMGGEWETIKYEKYELHNTHGGVEGADIKLEFKPNQIVNAEKIGLTQTIRTLKEGDPWYLGDNEGERNIAKSRTIQDGIDKGTSIDRIPKAGVNNPIYGALGGDENMDIANTQMPEQYLDESEAGQKVGGAYNRLGKCVPNEDPISAVLSDTPKRIVPLPRDSMCEFETTALALEGTQKGTYYGSVKWGWQTDEDGELDLIDFEKVKEGNPTKRFADSAQAWNQGQSRYQLFNPFKTSGGNIKLPVANPDSKQLLPLPDVSVYKAIKNNAKKKNTPLSGMMPVKTYKQLRSEYENARQADDTNQMIQTLVKLTGKLNAMDAKGDKYWQSPALKAQYFDPFNDAIQGQYRLLQEPTS